MKIIIGLGNPGVTYQNTRHNTGFWALEEIASALIRRGFDFSTFTLDKKSRSLVATGQVNTEKVLLVKPQTYMNSSGETARQLVNFHHLNPATDLLLIYDDIDLPLGKIRTTGTSAGGHRGVQSIFDHLHTNNISRIRIGILAVTKKPGEDLSHYVLQNFPSTERDQLQKTAGKIITAAEKFLGN